jgi:3-dehydroquinate synthase
MKTVKKAKTHFLQQWPREHILRRLTPALQNILIYDKILEDQVQAHLGFIPNRIAVEGGENAKTIENFAALARDILPRISGYAPAEIALIGLGGGSIGDLVGFMASVLKRGVRLVHVPSTYLAAIDSVHGGKTALNLGEFKNQIGTFYPAEYTLCIKALLDQQPEINLRSGYGELIKIALISGGEIFRELERAKKFDQDLMWHLLPQAIAAKKKIVAKDPFEKKGVRQLLNMGHTLGHAFELEQNLPHGLAVQHGLDFSLDWSRKLGLMKNSVYLKAKSVLAKNIAGERRMIATEKLENLLRQDKKVTKNSSLRFVLLKKPGRPVIKELKVTQIIEAAVEMEWAQ